MKSLSTEAAAWRSHSRSSRGRSQALAPALPYLVGIASLAVAVVGGAVASLSAALAILAAAAALGIGLLALAPPIAALFTILVVRGLTDTFAETPLVGGLNAGSVVGLILVGGAIALVASRLYERSRPVRGLATSALVLAALLYWFLTGILRYGVDESLVRELVRSTSILALALLAANGDRSINASRISTVVIVAAMVPALLVYVESAAHWSQMTSGEFRPRGSISHPNAAALLFGIAATIAAWKATYGSGGARYLYIAGMLVGAVLLTKSLGGLAQVIVALLALGALQRGHTALRWSIVALVFGVLALFVLDPFGVSRVSELDSTELAVRQGEEQDNNSFEWRLVNWSLFLDEWAEAPLLGHGLGATDELVAPLGHLPHSDPIRFLVETGVVGVSFLAIALVLLVRRLIRMSRETAQSSLAVGVLAALAGVGTHALATHVSFNTTPMYVLAALVGWLLASGGAADATEDVAPPESASRSPL